MPGRVRNIIFPTLITIVVAYGFYFQYYFQQICADGPPPFIGGCDFHQTPFGILREQDFWNLEIIMSIATFVLAFTLQAIVIKLRRKT